MIIILRTFTKFRGQGCQLESNVSSFLQVRAPNSTKYIRFFEQEGDNQVFVVDVLSETTFRASGNGSSGRTLNFSVNFPFIEGRTYYLLVDDGMLVAIS